MKRSTLRYLAAALLGIVACTPNTPEKMKEVKNGPVNLNYHSTGAGPVTLLFIHGAYINSDYWQEQVRKFSPQYRVVTMDLGGHGLSGRNRTDWSVAQFGRDVVAVLDQLDLKNVILIGHSMGGDAALEAAVARPDRMLGFIAIDYFKNAGATLPKEQTDPILAQMKTNFALTSEQYARKALLSPKTDSAIVKRVVNDFRTAYEPMGQPMMADVFQYGPREKELLPQLRRKLYLINVGYIPTNEAPLKTLAGASYEVVPMQGSCHYPMLEHPGELDLLLEQTIQKIMAGR